MLEEIHELSKLVFKHEYNGEDTLFEEGQKCDGLYILVSGELDIYLKGTNYRFSKPLRMRTGGAIFGEISFFFDTTRTATAVSSRYCKIFFLQKENKRLFKRICPRIVKRLYMQIYTYKDEALEAKKKILRTSVAYFANAEEKAIIELALQMETRYL